MRVGEVCLTGFNEINNTTQYYEFGAWVGRDLEFLLVELSFL